MILKLNFFQIDRLSEILGNLGVMFYASLVIPIFTKSILADLYTTISGVVIGTGCLIISIVIMKGG